MRLLLISLLTALTTFAQDDDIDALIEKLASDDFAVQGKAAKALEALGMKAVPALEKARKSEKPEIRQWADKILERLEEAERKEISALIERLGSKDFEEQGKAAEAIKKIGKRAIPHLKEALHSDNQEIRRWAGRLLDLLEAKASDFGGEIDKQGAFSSRLADRDKLIERGGGSKATEDAVLSALKWLARHQGEDGGWDAVGFADKCSGGKCAGAGSRDADIGVTGVALMAFLGAGYTHLSKDEFDGLKFGVVVARGAKWLLDRQSKEGCLGYPGPKYMYNHAISALVLTELYGMTRAESLRTPAQNAIDFLIEAQNPGKGWRYSTRCGDNDTSVTGWCVSALVAAERAGLAFPKKSNDGALAWFDEVTDEQHKVGYTHKGTGKVFVPGKNEEAEDHPAMTAAALASRFAISKNKKDPHVAGIEHLMNDLPQWKKNKVDVYYWFLGTQAVFAVEGPESARWKKWNEAMKEALVHNQTDGKGCTPGSWNPMEDRWGFEGGRVAVTALNALTLETYYRNVVMFKSKK